MGCLVKSRASWYYGAGIIYVNRNGDNGRDQSIKLKSLDLQSMPSYSQVRMESAQQID